jgi:hypothetical protein
MATARAGRLALRRQAFSKEDTSLLFLKKKKQKEAKRLLFLALAERDDFLVRSFSGGIELFTTVMSRAGKFA